MTYSETQLGIWYAFFEPELTEKLDALQGKVKAAFQDVSDDSIIPYVLDKAEEANLASAEDLAALREEFVADNGLPFVVDLKPGL